MTRLEKIDAIKSSLDQLTDEQLSALVDMACQLSRQTVYDELSDHEKAEIDAALDRLDRGEGVGISSVRARLDAKLRAAGV